MKVELKEFSDGRLMILWISHKAKNFREHDDDSYSYSPSEKDIELAKKTYEAISDYNFEQTTVQYQEGDRTLRKWMRKRPLTSWIRLFAHVISCGLSWYVFFWVFVIQYYEAHWHWGFEGTYAMALLTFSLIPLVVYLLTLDEIVSFLRKS